MNPNMIKFEYSAIFVPDGQSLVENLNSMGEEGWELIWMEALKVDSIGTTYRGVFKRVKE